MANDLNANDYVMYVDDTTPLSAATGAAYKMIACLTSVGLSLTVATVERNNRCGTNASPGNATTTFTGAGDATDEVGNPSVVSHEKLLALAQSKKVVWLKIANMSGTDPNAPILFREVQGFFTDYSEDGAQDGAYNFTYTFRVNGDIKTTETSA